MMSHLLQLLHHHLPILIVGLSVGATYALIALGYTMVYGVLRLINFAHGDIYMVGAVTGFYIAGWMVRLRLPLPLTLCAMFLGAMLVCAVLGFFIEYLAYRPLRNRPRIVVLITAIGVSLLLENVGQLKAVFGPDPAWFPVPITQSLNARIGHGPLVITRLDLLSLSLSLALMAILSFVILKTRTGLALRAVSHRFDTAMLMGVNTNRIISFTFMFGSALAAVAGVMDAIRYNVEPLMGIMPGLKAFVAAVLGGIGSVPGAVLGALIIGLAEAYLNKYASDYANAGVFAILIIILLVKPSGLLGSAAPEKV
jgi:branched-chain amino acid transport system permease protein